MNLGELIGNAEIEEGFSPLPAGDYSVQCAGGEFKNTKDGSGAYFNVRFNIVDHEKYTNRVIFHIFNIKNKSEKAMKIGLGQLRSFFKSSGIPESAYADRDENGILEMMNNLICEVRVKIKKDDTYGDKNVITSFKPNTPEGLKLASMKSPNVSDPNGATASAPW